MPALGKRDMTHVTSSQMASIYSALAKSNLDWCLESTRRGLDDASGGTHSVRTPPWFVMTRRTMWLWA